MSQIFLHPFVAGFILAAILAAIMSTVSSQLLVTSSALTQDFYMLLRKTDDGKNRDKEFVMVGRLAVFLVAIVATFLAWNPNDTILNLIGNAWAGFGAAFGPLVIFSLYWKKLTKQGAIAGMVSGALTVIIWIMLKDKGGIFELYEIIPGYIVSILATVIVSLITYKDKYDVTSLFNEMKRRLHA